MIKINNTEISDIKINDSSVSKVMTGGTKVWEKTSLIYQPLDILYSDASGNLSVSSQVLPASEGKVPIALCIAGTNFFGQGEKARWMSLKYMNCETPDTGSLTSLGIYFRYSYIGLNVTSLNVTHEGGTNHGHLITSFQPSPSNPIPSVFDSNGGWNISQLGLIGQYVVTTIDGKERTASMLLDETYLTSWQTDQTIDVHAHNNHAPVILCCSRYHTLGTSSGDWYVGAGGELSIIFAIKPSIQSKLAEIAQVYPTYCIDSLDSVYYWSSIPHTDNSRMYYVNTNDGYVCDNLGSAVVDSFGKYASLALLQY